MWVPENKTKATTASVEAHIAALPREAQRADCLALVQLMNRITGEPAKMWGPSIIGFGSYRYKYGSGREGEMCIAGFAARGKEMVVYVTAEGEGQAALLDKLGEHRMGKSCLYFRRLADLDIGVLEQLIVRCIAETRRRYG
jgi:hypothetical protein